MKEDGIGVDYIQYLKTAYCILVVLSHQLTLKLSEIELDIKKRCITIKLTLKWPGKLYPAVDKA